MKKLTAATLLLSAGMVVAQVRTEVEPQTLVARATLVLVPALVTTKSGEPVFTLEAKDFVVSDDGVAQQTTLEQDTGGEPLAMVVVVETGGSAAHQIDKVRGLGPLIEGVVGDVPHTVAVVEFDSTAGVSREFTADMDKVGDALAHVDEGDSGGAIFDAVGMAVTMLSRQPPNYRRVVLLISETVDHGSKLKPADALKAISDTNTAIYSIGFSSSKDEIKRDTAANMIHSSGDVDAGPPGGCMADDPDKIPDANQTKGKQALNCAGVFLPPLLLVKAATEVALNGLRQNVPETVARVSGGEYFKFSDVRSLERDLTRLANHMSNRYVLSFYPQSPHVGFHVIGIKLKSYPNLNLTARDGYWVDNDHGVGALP